MKTNLSHSLPGAETLLVEVERIVSNSEEQSGFLHDTLKKWIAHKRGAESSVAPQSQPSREPHDGWLNSWLYRNKPSRACDFWDDGVRKMAGDWADFRQSFEDVREVIVPAQPSVNQGMLEALLVATVELAIMRFNLQEEGEDILPERAKDIAIDATYAVQGEGTCDPEPFAEWKAINLAEAIPATPERGLTGLHAFSHEDQPVASGTFQGIQREAIPAVSAQPELCYVSNCVAYFTTQELDKQWGNDWNDAPYEHNAGTPYESHRADEHWEIVQVEFSGEFWEPCDGLSNSPWSVQQINRGFCPWLRTETSCIMAGATVEEFCRFITKNNGSITKQGAVSAQPEQEKSPWKK